MSSAGGARLGRLRTDAEMLAFINDLDAGESRHAIGDRGAEPLTYVWGHDNLGPGGGVRVSELTPGAVTQRGRAARRGPFNRDRRG